MNAKLDVKFVDQSYRDGQQSHWGLRMRGGHMLPLAPQVSEAGFSVVDLTGCAMFDVMVRELREDPWETLDAMRAAMPGVDLRAGSRPNAALGTGFTLAPDAVVDKFAELMIRHGINSFWIYDCLYNMDQMKRLSKVVVDSGGRAFPAIMYAESEFHTDEYFADKVRTISSWGFASGIYLEDASGVLTPERARTLLPALREAAQGLPIEMHFHNTTGLAPLNYVIGFEHGLDIIHTASEPLANGPSLPSTEMMVDNVVALGHTHSLDMDRIREMAEYFTAIAKEGGYQTGVPAEYSVRPYQHQLPGGMLGTLRNQLATHGLTDRLDAVLEESALVRKEFGSPVMATPISQLVGIQALLNVTSGERYGQVTDDVIRYFLGRLGQPPGPVDPDVKDRVLGTARANDLAKVETPQPTMAELRSAHGKSISDEELLLRVMMQQEHVDAMKASGPMLRDLAPRGRHPVTALLASLSRPACSSVRYSDSELSISLSRK